MQFNQHRSLRRRGHEAHYVARVSVVDGGEASNGAAAPAGLDDGPFVEQVPEYLREGYRALMRGDGTGAIAMWEAIYNRYPSAEVCAHLARAHYYQTFFESHPIGHPKHAQHIRQMRLWAERALSLNPNSSIGHAMLAGAIGRQAQISGSIKEIVRYAGIVERHARRAVSIDNTWIGHFVLGNLYREIAAVHPGLRAIARMLHIDLPEASYQQSLEHFQEVLRQCPDNNTIFAEMALTYEKMGERALAGEMVQRFASMAVYRHPIGRQATDAAVARFREKGYDLPIGSDDV